MQMTRWQTLTAAPHRLMFFTGMSVLLASSAWWGLHLFARRFGTPVAALDVSMAPIWAHAFLMLFLAFPSFFFGFLFTVFPRWMNGPQVPRGAYIATSLLFLAATLAWITAIHAGPPLGLLATLLAAAALAVAIVALTRVLLAAEQTVAHAYCVLTGLCVQFVALAGFAVGVALGSDFALHFAVRTALWGGLLPVFFTVCHRMIPFFSQGVVRGYVPWRPQWILIAVIALAYARLLMGTAGGLRPLIALDVALFALTATCAVRWTSLRTRGNPLLWSLYAGFAWLPVAALLQAGRDLGFALTREWLLGRAPIHALGMGFFGSMLVAMVTRVTMGHSGRPLQMDRATLGCFLGVQAAALARVASEVVAAPQWMQALLLASVLLWLAAFAVWSWRLGRIYLAPRIDGRPG
jgi:uncharacterized protein involved in response to NO